MYSIPLGAALALIGNTVISASFTLIKYAHMTFGDKYMRSRWWWFGMLIMAPGELFNLIAFGFAPTTLVSPLGASGICTTALFARIWLKERFEPRGYLGVLMVAAGGVMISFSMPPNETSTTLELLYKNIAGGFSMFLAICMTVMLAIVFEHSLFSSVYVLAVTGMICSLSCRGVASMLFDAPTHPLFFAMLLYALLTIAIQCVAFQKALSSFSLSHVVPLHFAGMQLLVSVGSGLLYDDMLNANVLMFVTGLTLCVGGAFVVAGARHT